MLILTAIKSQALLIKALKGTVITCLFLTYPYLVYRGIESGMVWIAPAIFSALFLRQAYVAKNNAARLLKAGLAICLLLGTYYMQTFTAKALPVLIQLLLMYFFGRTLLKDKGPSFVESFVRLQFPEFPPAIGIYCHQLTLVWTLFFAMNAIVVTILAIWGTTFWWSLYNGALIYLLMGLLIAIEYIYRRIRFADLSILHKGIPDPISTIKTMAVNGRKIWMDIQAR
jgi:uncharacterized membrane protein